MNLYIKTECPSNKKAEQAKEVIIEDIDKQELEEEENKK